MSDVLLRMSGVAKRFGSTVALDGVDLEVRSGEVLALVGENGAGKSTLMKVLSGAIVAESGEMTLDGDPYGPAGPADARSATLEVKHGLGWTEVGRATIDRSCFTAAFRLFSLMLA